MISNALKELRVHCDSLVYLLEHDIPRSPEVTKSTNSLKMARAWMGKLLGLMGEESPYKNDGKRHSVQDIEPVSDVAVTSRSLDHMNGIERVDWLRQELSSLQRDYDVMCESSDSHDVKVSTCLISVYQHLAESRFWLGFELARIRDNA